MNFRLTGEYWTEFPTDLLASSNIAVSNIYKYVQGLHLLYRTEENQLESNLSRDESFLTLTNYCSVRLVTSYHLMKYQNLMTSFVKKQTLSLIQCS